VRLLLLALGLFFDVQPSPQAWPPLPAPVP
jgi:hypothetical protein